jgi:16S rRNA (cytosine967-C5)-methyltransferase
MAGPDHRSVAWKVLDAVRTGDDLATAALRRITDQQSVAPEVVSPAHRLVMGTLRERRYLDTVLAGLVTKKLPRKDKRLMDLLRLAIYEMFFMEAIPSYATGSRYVELARRSKGQRVAGFVNAVLRAASRVDPNQLKTTRDSLPIADRLSVPDWLLRGADAAFGDGALDELERLSQPADIALRVAGELPRSELMTTLTNEGLSPKVMPENARGLTLPPGESPYQTLAFAKGLFRPQDRASQFVSDLVQAAGQGALLDGCAGSGTKTLAFVESGTFKRVVAADLQPNKLDRLVARTHLPVETVATDLADPDLPPAGFDTVFIDAPCTGVGTLRRHPELKWRRSERDGKSNAATQSLILAGVAPLVKPGGLLVYAVCSWLLEEGPAVVNAFLADHPDFALEPPAQHLPPTARELAGRMAATNARQPWYQPGMLMTVPTVLDGDVFFVAVLRKDKGNSGVGMAARCA